MAHLAIQEAKHFFYFKELISSSFLISVAMENGKDLYWECGYYLHWRMPALCLPPSLPSVVFDGLGDVMKPTVTPQAGDVDTSMANMASSK